MKEAIHHQPESHTIQSGSGKNQASIHDILADYRITTQRLSSQVAQRVGDIESGEGIPPYGEASIRGTFSKDRNRDRTRMNGALLNHYMVVRNGEQYQFPIRAVNNPYNSRRNARALRPEPFGGNQSWTSFTGINSEGGTADEKLKRSRNLTLATEYREEAGTAMTVDDTKVDKSVFFRSGAEWPAQGTTSIVRSDTALTSSINPNLAIDAAPAQKEMAGTIVIDTTDIETQEIVGAETEIKAKIQVAQAAFVQAHHQGVLYTPEDFGNNSEILLMLVHLIAQQVVERNRAAAE